MGRTYFDAPLTPSPPSPPCSPSGEGVSGPPTPNGTPPLSPPSGADLEGGLAGADFWAALGLGEEEQQSWPALPPTGIPVAAGIASCLPDDTPPLLSAAAAGVDVDLLSDLGFGQVLPSAADSGCAGSGEAVPSASVVHGVAVEGRSSHAEPTSRCDKRRRDPAVFTTPHAKGDSVRCRKVYEEVLRSQLETGVLRRYRQRATHLAVRQCRHIAIVHNVAFPPYNLLANAGFDVDAVALCEWEVPHECGRSPSKINEEGRCPEGRCVSCRA